MTGQNRAASAFIKTLQKRAFVPFPQGAPPPDPNMGMGGGMPMDPSMMGGAPGGAPPMDPSMMGGAPPMDPSMMGGAPPMDPAMMDPAMMGGDPAAAGMDPNAMPPADPAALGAMGAPGSIQINPQELIDIINAAKGGGPSSPDPAAAAAGGAPAPAGQPKEAKPKKPGTQEILDAVNGIGAALGVGGGMPPAGGMTAQASFKIQVPKDRMRKLAASNLMQLMNQLGKAV